MKIQQRIEQAVFSARIPGPILIATILILTLVSACKPANDSAGAENEASTETADIETSPAADAATPGPTGTATIEGRLVYEGQVPNLKPLRMDADPQCAAKHDEPVQPAALVLGEGNALANVFVKVSSGLPEGTYPAPSEPLVMDQHGCMYRPHVMGMVAGQELKVLNSDGLLHNVHSLSKVNPSFNRAMPGSVKEATFELSRPEEAFRVKCDVHPWMSAYITVMDNPFFDVSDGDGSFSITGLPAGTYVIEAWHERLGSQTATVTVADGETATQDFTFSRDEP